MANKKLCTEYEAACMTGLSPKLLRWLTSHAPKSGISRKLQVAKQETNIYYFEHDELLEFNNWLKAPWPKKDGKRPGIPKAIRREITEEANGACAICHGHKDTCEAAHLDPVHKSHNNHPENLLWLCANHHTAYDGNLFGPNEENAEFVSGFKTILHHYKLMLWRTQHEISEKLLTVLEDCNRLAEQLATAKTSEQKEAIETIASKTLTNLPNLAPVSKTDSKYAAFQSISANTAALIVDKSPIRTRLKMAQALRKEYVAAYGYVACPLCKATGRHEGSDCPVCNGDREIDKRFANEVEVRDYEKVNCPICKGKGSHRGDICPACGGDAQMDRRYADAVDPRDYRDVPCPVCNGTGRRKGSDCPACEGDKTMERRHADAIDVRDYEEVNCPVCNGRGRLRGEDCPACDGDRTMERRFANGIDASNYDKVDCPVCDGSGSFKGNNCPACSGDAQIERRKLDNIDKRDFEMVKCPICKGRGHYRDRDCRACNGEGEIERRFAADIEPREYDEE